MKKTFFQKTYNIIRNLLFLGVINFAFSLVIHLIKKSILICMLEAQAFSGRKHLIYLMKLNIICRITIYMMNLLERKFPEELNLQDTWITWITLLALWPEDALGNVHFA